MAVVPEPQKVCQSMSFAMLPLSRLIAFFSYGKQFNLLEQHICSA